MMFAGIFVWKVEELAKKIFSFAPPPTFVVQATLLTAINSSLGDACV